MASSEWLVGRSKLTFPLLALKSIGTRRITNGVSDICKECVNAGVLEHKEHPFDKLRMTTLNHEGHEDVVFVGTLGT